MSSWIREQLGVHSWVAWKSDRAPAPRIAVCSFTRGRLESRITCHTWAQQTGLRRDEYEVVFAEFGESPTVFPDDASRECFDCYLFAYMPERAPYALSWWRNVAVWRARAPYTLLVDGDIALAPEACAAFLLALEKSPDVRPAAAKPRRILRTRSLPAVGASYEAISAGAESLGIGEAVWSYDTAAFKRIGGWCEAWTGYGRDRRFFHHRAWRTFAVALMPMELCCHIPSWVPPGQPKCKNHAMRCPLVPGAPDPKSLADKRDNGQPYWPVEGWPLGDPCLLERNCAVVRASG